MTSHVAYVIYATLTLITTQGLCNISFFLMSSSLLCIWDRILLCSLPFFLFFLSMLPYSLCIGSGIKCIMSTCNRSTLNIVFKRFLKTTKDVITNLRAHPHLYADPIAQLRGVDTQVTSDDPMGIARKNTANDLRETWRRLSPNTNCWNRKSLHSFRNRGRLRTSDCVCLQQTARESKRLYDFVVVASQLLRMGLTLGALQAS